jgi:hypothetical protein
LNEDSTLLLQFWRSFFEAAAQVHVPTGGDYSVTETDADTEGERTTTAEDYDGHEGNTITTESQSAAESNVTSTGDEADRSGAEDQSQSRSRSNVPTDHSFTGVVQSTPARAIKRGGGYADMTQDSSVSSDASWTPSHGTMLNVLNQQIREGFKLDQPKHQTKVYFGLFGIL